MSTKTLAAAVALLYCLEAKTPAAELSPRQIYQRAGPAVVLILCVGQDGNGELGTGSVIDEKGHILTNAHVVIRHSTGRPFDTIRVYTKPARVTGDPKQDLTNPLQARVLKWDSGLDLALLELAEKPSRLTALPFGDAGRIESGERVVAIGHPEQGGLWTLTSGVVSTVIADLGGIKGKDVFQTDASINRGNSGGPLIDADGGLIGVNTSMARKAADGLTITSVNFAVKASVAKNWLASTGVDVDYAEVASLDDSSGAAAAAPPASKAEPGAAPKAALAKTPEPPAPKAEAPAAEPAPPAKAQAPEKALPAAPATPKPAIVTPAKPYKIQDLIAREIAEMEDLEKEMQGEVEKRRGLLNQGD